MLALVIGACSGEPSPIQQAKTATEYLDSDRQRYELEEIGETDTGRGWRRIVWRQGNREEQSLTLAAAPRRIVSQSLGADEVLVDLGLGDRLFALSELSADPAYSPIAERAASWQRVSSTDAESLLALRADLLFTASYATPETLAQLRKAGAPVLQLAGYESLGDAREKIRVIGFAVGEDARATELIARLDADLSEARRIAGSRFASAAPLRVVSYGDGWVRGGRTLFDDVVREIGAINVAAEQGLIGWPRISAEEVARWDFDVFVVTAAPGREEQARRLILDHPALRRTAAAQRPIVAVPNALADSVSHHLGRLALELARGLTGEDQSPDAARTAPPPSLRQH